MEAEKKLLLPENEHGAFLIRDSESRHNDYSLSGNIFNMFIFIFQSSNMKGIVCYHFIQTLPILERKTSKCRKKKFLSNIELIQSFTKMENLEI